LATAIAAVVSLLGISQGFTSSFADVYAAHSIDIVVSRQGSSDRLSSSVDASMADRIDALPSVARAAAVLLETMSLEDDGIYGIPAMGIAPNSWLLDDYQLSTSSTVGPTSESSVPPAAQAPASRQVMLGINLAERVGAEIGGTVNLFDEPYQVAAIFKSPAAWENGSMIFPLDELQRLTDRAGQATYINVVLAGQPSQSLAAAAVQEIESLDAKLHALPTDEYVATDTRMQLASAMAWMTSVIALLIGSIGTLNTMLTSVMERTREIGILRAIGWPKRRVVTMIMLESCGLAVVASLIGSLLAMLLTWGLAQAPAARGILSPSIDFRIVLQGFGLALGIGLLGAILPAWHAAQMLPTEAFREH
jgi:putative ABC transport system permease protein